MNSWDCGPSAGGLHIGAAVVLPGVSDLLGLLPPWFVLREPQDERPYTLSCSEPFSGQRSSLVSGIELFVRLLRLDARARVSLADALPVVRRHRRQAVSFESLRTNGGRAKRCAAGA